MSNLPKALVLAAAVSFLLAVVTTLMGPLGSVEAEGFSRACTNLAVLGIGLHLVDKK